MLRICIPVHNEATTIGVLLWRLRSVFQGFSREYDVVVYDDASTDGTGEVLVPYESVMPLTVLRGASHRGYAASIDALVRHVAADDEYARRDAMVLLQGDFTESPEHLPELVKRFEGGADLVAVHRTVSDATPQDERRLRRWGRWAVKPFLRLPPVADPFTGFRLVRISVLRDLLKALGNRPVCAGEGWAANIDFALNVTPFARRIENVEFAPRYDVRQRASRRRGWQDVVALFHWARSTRGTVRPSPGARSASDPTSRTPVESAAPTAPADRAAARAGRDARSTTRDEKVVEKVTRIEERKPRPERNASPPRPERTATPPRPERSAAPPRDPRPAPVASPVATTPMEPAPAGDLADSAAPSPERKSRRRRRRSKRDRSVSATDDGALPGSAGTVPGSIRADAPDDDGTSDDGEGEEETGDDNVSAVESGDGDGDGDGDGGADQSADGARRKRRNRRRRRGRRTGGPDAASPENVPPPATEPPAA